MRLKTSRRLILLVIGLAVLGAAAFAGVYIRSWQRDRLTRDAFEKGQLAFKNHDYFNALGHTGDYLNRVRSAQDRAKDDRFPAAALAYAESRRSLEEANGDHLRQAIAWYRQYLDRRPDDRVTAITLLKLFNQVGLFVEARDQADRLLAGTPNPAEQLTILRELGLALFMSGRGEVVDPRLEPIIDRTLALAPLDVQSHIFRFSVLARRNRRADAIALGDSVLAAHPAEPAAHLIAAYARLADLRGPDRDECITHLCAAAGLDARTAARTSPVAYPDEVYVLHLTQGFDSLRQYEHAKVVLVDAADKVKSPLLERLAIRRLWQDGEDAAVQGRTASLDLGSADAHPEQLGFRALSLIRSGKPAEAEPIRAALAKREGDFRADAWSKAIALVAELGKPETTAATITRWKDVVKASPAEPAFMLLHAEALAAAGRTEEARAQWQDAARSPVAAGWAVPWVRLAESYLAEGRAADAVTAAGEAAAIAGNRAAVALVWLEAQAIRLQSGSEAPPTAADVLSRLEDVMAQLAGQPDSPTLRDLRARLIVPRVILLARANRAADAKTAALEAIHAEPPHRPELLQRLASVSAAARLGVESEAMKRVEAIAGQTPSVAFAKAVELAEAGRPDDGLSIVKAAADASPADVSAQFALARYMERIGHADALRTWIRLGDGNPQELNVQRACLQSNAAAGDRDFIERCIQRSATLTGAEPSPAEVIAFCARARAAMFGRPSKDNRDRAVAMLGQVVAAQPRLVEPKVLLAAALAHSDPGNGIAAEIPRAIAQLNEAATIEPRNPAIGLELGRLLQAQRDFAQAREVLSRIASDQSNADPARLAAAEMLINQGDAAPVAIQALGQIVQAQGDRASGPLLSLLAQAYLSVRQDDLAAPIFARLADGAARDPESIFSTARFYTLRKDTQRAQAVLDRIEPLNLGPGVKEHTLARLAIETDDQPAIITRFEAAVAAAPTRAAAWRDFANYLLGAGKAEQAREVAQRGLRANPNDAALATLASKSGALASVGPGDDLRSLISALSTDPAQAPVVEALKALEAGMASGRAETADGIGALADRYPNITPLQIYLAGRLASIAPDRAAILITRCMSANPTDPAPAKAAAAMFLELKRWPDMLAAAQAWQTRDLSRPIEADLAVAEACLYLKRFDEGLKVTSPRIQAALADPDGPMAPGVINIHACLLASASRESEARAMLAPLLASQKVRSIWLAVAVDRLPDLATVSAWLKQLRPTIPEGSTDEIISLAAGYQKLIARFPDEKLGLAGESVQLLERLTQSPSTATAAAWEALGMTRHAAGPAPYTAAVEAYRKAIELDAKRANALNNLAFILFEVHGKFDEALALSVRAVEAEASAANLDTLASIHAAIAEDHRRNGRAERAAESFKAAAAAYLRVAPLIPGEPKPMLDAAQMFEDARDPQGAARVYETLLGYASLPASSLAATKNNLAMALVRLNRGKADLDRAVTLATEATRLIDHPGLFDTLGWCQLAAGASPAAEASFRTAVQKAAAAKTAMPSATIGLATALAEGPPEKRTEAAQLLDSIDSVKLSDPDDKARYQKARELISSR